MRIGDRFVATAAALFVWGAACAAWAQYPETPQSYPLPTPQYFGPPPAESYGPPPAEYYGPPGGPSQYGPPGPGNFVPGLPPYDGGPGPNQMFADPQFGSPVDDAGVLPPPGPLEETPTYRFFDFGYWFPTEGWSNSFEIGVNGSAGNSETFSLRTGAHIERKAGRATYTLDIKYAKTLADAVETQHNALLNSNAETDLGDSLWTTFFKTSLEYDEFKAWNVRTAMNAGLGFHLIKASDARFIVRFGSGVSRELGGPEDDYIPEAIYGMEFDRKITKRQKLYATIDYYPDWTDYNDFRMVTNAGWEFLLDQEANLSLKLGAIDRYDSTPHGRKPNDLDYSLVLLWKQ